MSCPRSASPTNGRSEAATPADPMATAARIGDRLWIGGAHAPLPQAVTVVVTLDDAAPPIITSGVTETRAPFPDSRWHPIAVEAATAAIRAAETGPDTGVLVRCRHGLNRSALIAALVLVAQGTSPQDAIDTICHARPGALTNPYYVDLVRIWPADPMRDQGCAALEATQHRPTIPTRTGDGAC